MSLACFWPSHLYLSPMKPDYDLFQSENAGVWADDFLSAIPNQVTDQTLTNEDIGMEIRRF